MDEASLEAEVIYSTRMEEEYISLHQSSKMSNQEEADRLDCMTIEQMCHFPDPENMAHALEEELKLEEKPKPRHTLEEERAALTLYISSAKSLIANYNCIQELAQDLREEDLLGSILYSQLQVFKTLRPCLAEMQGFIPVAEDLEKILPDYRKCSSWEEQKALLDMVRSSLSVPTPASDNCDHPPQ